MDTVNIKEVNMEPYKKTQLQTSLTGNLDLSTDKLSNGNGEGFDRVELSEKVYTEQTRLVEQNPAGEDKIESNFHEKQDNETIKIQLDNQTSRQDIKDNVFHQQFESTKDNSKYEENKYSAKQSNVSGCLNSEEFPVRSPEECYEKTDFEKLGLEGSNQNIDDSKFELPKKTVCSFENDYYESDMTDSYERSKIITKEDQNTPTVHNEQENIKTTLDVNECKSFTTAHDLVKKSFATERRKSNGDNKCNDSIDFQTKSIKIHRKNRKSLTNSLHSNNKDECFPHTLSDKSVISSLLNDKHGNNTELDSEDSSSSFKSASTKKSISSTSSSQQLVIDHSLDDTENVKLAPLKLSIKRKAVNNSVGQQTNNMLESEKHGNLCNSSINQNIKLRNCVSRLNVSSVISDEGFNQLNQSKENGCDTFKHKRFDPERCNVHPNSIEIQAKQNILKNRFYKCEHCMTFHEEWNFFNHVRDHHNRYICFHCLRLFTTAEKLSLHMENKHDLEQNHFSTVKEWNVADSEDGRNLTCCTCQHVFQVNESFVEHNCSEFLRPCDICEQRGRHTNHCKYNNARNFLKNRIKKKFFVSLEAQLPPDKSVTPIFVDQEMSSNAFNDTQNNKDNKDFNTLDGETCVAKITLPENIESVLTAALEPPPPIPKLVLPKIMLRVPKQYQKSVDAEFSYTDSEEFDEDEHDDHNSTTQSVEDSTNIADQSLPLFDVDTNSATETATEASIFNERSAQMTYENTGPQDNCKDSLGFPNSNLSCILDEIGKTNMDILESKDVAADKQDTTERSNCTKDSETMVNQIWSPTPPASPQSRSLTPGRAIAKSDFEISCIKEKKDPSLEAENEEDDICKVSEENIEKIHSPIDNESNLSFKGKYEMEELNSQKNDLTETGLGYPEGGGDDTMLIKNVDITNKSTSIQQSLNATIQSDTIEIANEDTLSVDLLLDRPLDKFEIVDFIRLCLKSVYALCLYCNHARRIAVSAKSLVMHLIAQHRFTATVDSITAEELKSETIVTKLKNSIDDLENEYLNLSSYCTIGTTTSTKQFNERIYECFQCRYVTSTHKELYMHNRRLHMKTAILCFMCRLNFFSFSEILCHICPGEPTKSSIFDVKYRCCFCEMTNLPSAFRLMVHLRKKHSACDVCLEDCGDQSKLSSHVWKHKLHHLCYRCGIAYRNKQDITKHLYWKHGTESIKCKRCLQKRWRHVYHFCVPPTNFVCDECTLCFSKAMYLEVHKRIHTGDLRYACTEEECKDVFVSRRLLLKHASAQHETNASDILTPKPELDTTPLAAIDATLNTENIDEEMDAQNKENLNKLTPVLKDQTPVEDGCEKTPQTNKEVYRKKRKRNINSKESLEDLNLIAPNLSESDSFDESDAESKPNNANNSLDLPKVVLSPLSESDEQVTPKSNHGFSKNIEFEEKIPDIWKNLLKDNSYINPSYQDGTLSPLNSSSTKSDYPMPKVFHVCVSDHDYCKMSRPQTIKASKAQELTTKSSRKTAKSFRSKSRQNSDNLSSDFSTESSSSCDSSSCSCGSNCSCSSSDSDSSSSTSSSNNSNLSSTPKTVPKRQRKKSMRKKSVSPLKPLQSSPVDVNEVNDEVDKTNITEDAKSPPLNESDLETAESETDEEFYDEHPQKLANELLAQKRAILMAQTRMSPSHNFDIVENSRPSTPSLPEDLSVFGEKRIKSKKKKRDRKSTAKKSNTNLDASIEYASTQDLHFPTPHAQTNQNQIICDINSSLPSAQQSLYSTGTFSREVIGLNTNQTLPLQPLEPVASASMKHRSEGSSCSDMDATLKRSKRTRRPNKFYGYSSEDDNMSTVLAPPLMVGMQLIKPQPPPQLIWAKEDLPAPTQKHKIRTSKTSNSSLNISIESNMSNGGLCRKKMKRTSNTAEKTQYKRKCKDGQADFEDTTSLPPIPTLKIRSSQLLAVKSNHSDESAETSSEEDVDDTVFEVPKSTQFISATDKINEIDTQKETIHVEVPKTTLPVPEATVFKQKIPPALLPNPDFATLQYFKANNIRYPIRPPAGARLAREGEAVYCYCRCPYDEVSEMIACDGENCLIEWFHFECVGIMLAPQGKWFCAECRPKYSEELYPTTKT